MNASFCRVDFGKIERKWDPHFPILGDRRRRIKTNLRRKKWTAEKKKDEKLSSEFNSHISIQVENAKNIIPASLCKRWLRFFLFVNYERYHLLWYDILSLRVHTFDDVTKTIIQLICVFSCDDLLDLALDPSVCRYYFDLLSFMASFYITFPA